MENKSEVNFSQFPKIYKELGINTAKLGCIMLDVDGSEIKKPPFASEKDFFTSKNPEHGWIKGFVAGQTPHVTLLYGLLQSGNEEYRPYVDAVLKGWSCNAVVIDHIGHFDSPYPDEPYFCIVAHLVITDALKSAHQRLSLLPHINTYPEYKAHVTIAYIRKDDLLRDGYVAHYNNTLSGTALPAIGLNYGGEIK